MRRAVPVVSPAPFSDAAALVRNAADATKLVRLAADLVAAGQTSDLHAPNADGTLPLLQLAQTWTAQQAFAADVGVFFGGATAPGAPRCCAWIDVTATANNNPYYKGIVWGTPPAAAATDQVTGPGVYYNPAVDSLELNLLPWPSALGDDEKGKLRADGGTEPLLHWTGGVEAVQTGANDLVFRLRNDPTVWWEFALTTNTLAPLVLRYFASSALQTETMFPKASGTFVVNARRLVTANTVLSVQDRFVMADASSAGGNISVALTFGNQVPPGTEVTIKNVGTVNNVDVLVNGFGTIDGGGAVIPLPPGGNWLVVYADGITNAWFVTSSSLGTPGSFAVGGALGAGTGGNAFAGVTVASAISDAASGYDNVRMGMAFGLPAVYLEHGGAQWRITNVSGQLFYVVPGSAIVWRVRNDGGLALGGNACAASALLDVQGTTKGTLLSRMTTTQKNAIGSPAEGLEVYDLTLHKKCVYTGSAWETITSV